MDAEPLPGFHGLIGRSAAMQALFRRMERIGPYDVPVLIQGESGTGKELVAAALHQLSSRRTARFEPVNCGTLTRELLRSELFGHERGAFTGAVERRPGLLREAHGGSLFLDEVAELPLDAQPVLLRFLEDGEIRPVGASRTVHVDVRVVAATHRDLETWVVDGRFREDLYYRLREVALMVPPLRARLDDLPLLVEHYRRQLNARYGFAIAGVTDAALRALAAREWRGNVRQLRMVLGEAMIFRRQGWLMPGDIDLPTDAAGTGSVVGAVAAQPGESRAARTRSRRRETALQIAADRGTVSSGQLARACGVSEELARRELVALARLGRLRRVGGGRVTRYVPP